MIHELNMAAISGESVAFSAYKDKYSLVVNVASR